MIRLRVSDLDAWVGFVEPERPEFEKPTEDFLAYLRREEPPTEAMKAGIALHSLLETAEIGEEFGDDGVEQDGFLFIFYADCELELPMEREPEVMEWVIDTPSGLVLLRGRIDSRDATGLVTDYKLTARFDAERYGRSLQWKAYLAMTGERSFRYLVFEAKRRDDMVAIKDIHDLTFHRYSGMEEEVARRVAELAAFVAEHVPSLVTQEAA